MCNYNNKDCDVVSSKYAHVMYKWKVGSRNQWIMHIDHSKKLSHFSYTVNAIKEI